MDHLDDVRVLKQSLVFPPGIIRPDAVVPTAMFHLRSPRLDYLLVAGGLGLALLSFRFGGATQRACPGIESVVYDLLSVHPPAVRVTAVDVTEATIEWYDGCNWHRQSLLPVGLGFAVSLVGAGRRYRNRAGDPETGE
jgi:hypothetical protein